MKHTYELLFDRECSDTPSRYWQQLLIRWADILCDLQTAFVLFAASCSSCGSSHGTTKLGNSLSGAGIQIGERYYSMGVDAVTASFVRRLECLWSILDHLPEGTITPELNTLLLSLKSSLSDRCKVEIKWARLLEERKMNIVQEQFTSLSVMEQKQKAEVFLFF